MEISAEWAAILVAIVFAIMGGFYNLIKATNESATNISILKRDVTSLNDLMNDLDDHIVTIWQTIDKINSKIANNTTFLQEHIADLDSRIDTIEIAHARQHDENLRGR